jgi:hypothetical protein
VAAGRRCRQLRYGRVGKSGPWGLIVSIEDLTFGAEGRLLAASGNDGVRFWDVASGTDVGYLPIGRQDSVFFDPEGKWLYTSGRSRLRRWPFEPDTAPTVYRIGPPRAFEVPANHEGVRACATGRDDSWPSTMRPTPGCFCWTWRDGRPAPSRSTNPGSPT